MHKAFHTYVGPHLCQFFDKRSCAVDEDGLHSKHCVGTNHWSVVSEVL